MKNKEPKAATPAALPPLPPQSEEATIQSPRANDQRLDSKDQGLDSKDQSPVTPPPLPADERIAELERELQECREFERHLAEALDANPQAQKLFDAIMDRECATRLREESDKLEAEYERNLETSLDGLEKFLEEHRLDEADAKKLLERIVVVIGEGIAGHITPDTLDMVLKAHTFESRLEAARREGEIAGRNAKIKEHLRSLATGSTMPNLTGGAMLREQKKPSIFTLAREA